MQGMTGLCVRSLDLKDIKVVTKLGGMVDDSEQGMTGLWVRSVDLKEGHQGAHQAGRHPERGFIGLYRVVSQSSLSGAAWT